MKLADLSTPFPPEAIHWRSQQLTRNKDKALALAYLNARDVMDRLDDVCGPEKWNSYYDETPSGRVICKLSILCGDQWITKSDGAGNTAVEAEKGGISDALKRAAVSWGIGRYLYDLEALWAPCETYGEGDRTKFSKWKPEAYDMFKRALAQVGKPTGVLNDKTREWLEAQIQSVHMTPRDILEHLSPKTLPELTYEQLPDIQAFINSKKKAA